MSDLRMRTLCGHSKSVSPETLKDFNLTVLLRGNASVLEIPPLGLKYP